MIPDQLTFEHMQAMWELGEAQLPLPIGDMNVLLSNSTQQLAEWGVVFADDNDDSNSNACHCGADKTYGKDVALWAGLHADFCPKSKLQTQGGV